MLFSFWYTLLDIELSEMGSKENLYYSWKEIGSKLALTLGELKEQKYFYDVILDCKDLDDDGPFI